MKNARRIARTSIRFLLMIVPFVWIFSTIDLTQLLVTIRHVAPWTIPVLLSLCLFTMLLQGVRWWVLIKAFIPDISLKKTLASHFSAQFYSIVLPTSAAQDVVRAMLLSRHSDSSVIWGSTFMSRLLGLLVLFIFSLFGMAWLGTTGLPAGFKPAAVTAFAAFALLCILSFSKKVSRPIRRLFARFNASAPFLFISKIRDVIYNYRRKKTTLGAVFAITVFMQLVMIGTSMVLLYGISGRWYAKEILTFVPLIEIVAMSVPLTPSGIGIREGLIALMFQRIGVTQEQIGAYIILSLLSILVKLVGIVPVLFTFRGIKPGPPDARCAGASRGSPNR